MQQRQHTPQYKVYVCVCVCMQQREHTPPYKDWSVAVSTGGQDSLWKVFEMLVEPGYSTTTNTYEFLCNTAPEIYSNT
jgi:hypothetical protein